MLQLQTEPPAASAEALPEPLGMAAGLKESAPAAATPSDSSDAVADEHSLSIIHAEERAQDPLEGES